jgi:hypothetical protein
MGHTMKCKADVKILSVNQSAINMQHLVAQDNVN